MVELYETKFSPGCGKQLGLLLMIESSFGHPKMDLPSGVQLTSHVFNSLDFLFKFVIIDIHVRAFLSIEPIKEFIHDLSDSELFDRLVHVIEFLLENRNAILFLQNVWFDVLHLDLGATSQTLHQP